MMKHPEIVAIETDIGYYEVNVDGVEEITYDERGPFMWSGPAFRLAMQNPGELPRRIDVWVPLAAVVQIEVYRP